jgi:hypothetical protein
MASVLGTFGVPLLRLFIPREVLRLSGHSTNAVPFGCLADNAYTSPCHRVSSILLVVASWIRVATVKFCHAFSLQCCYPSIAALSTARNSQWYDIHIGQRNDEE